MNIPDWGAKNHPLAAALFLLLEGVQYEQPC